MKPNKLVKSARIARPTRKQLRYLLAAFPRRWAMKGEEE